MKLRLRLIAVCPSGQSILCKQACAAAPPTRGKRHAKRDSAHLRCIPLAADRRMPVRSEHPLQASLRRMLWPDGRMAVFETKFDKGVCRLAQKRYNCLVRQISLRECRFWLEEIWQTILYLRATDMA